MRQEGAVKKSFAKKVSLISSLFFCMNETKLSILTFAFKLIFKRGLQMRSLFKGFTFESFLVLEYLCGLLELRMNNLGCHCKMNGIDHKIHDY
jgi:hypothetical protein